MNDLSHTIGILSGTSVDAIDVALVAHHTGASTLLASHSHPIPLTLKKNIQQLCQPSKNEINLMGQCDTQLGLLFAEAINTLLQQHPNINVSAIGSHGQTIRHQPTLEYPFSLQIANPHIIAAQTGLTTISDFRRHDMAHGGQGAPLAPIFHQHAFWQNGQSIAVVNIGGMANVSLLNGHDRDASFGFDTGPGNCLMDAWIMQQQGKSFDRDGQWAEGGTLIPALLAKCLEHPFLQQPAPKSTGHEQFHLGWLSTLIAADSDAQAIQRTLLEFTAQSITQGIAAVSQDVNTVVLCGGGAYNKVLCKRITALHHQAQVCSSADLGMAPEWVEAVMFAWLAHQHQRGNAVDMRHITGARKASVLGTAYNAP